MHFSGITRRWVINTLGVISSLLLLVSIIASIAIHFYYYEYVKIALNSHVNDTVSTFLTCITIQTSSLKIGRVSL